MTCDICDIIIRFLQAADSPEVSRNVRGWSIHSTEKHLGRFKDLISGNCRHHAQLIHEYPPVFNDPVDAGLNYELDDVYLARPFAHAASLSYLIRQSESSALCVMSKNFGLLSSPGKVQSDNLSWIDVDAVRSWKADCDTNHQECTKWKQQEQPRKAAPCYLIDLESQSLIKTAKSVEYWALSYVWGGASQLLLTTTTMRYLQQPRSLEKEEIRSQVPLTVRHAMALAKALHCRYFWVDSLCIAQNEGDLASMELANMHNIFGQASVVLVAANGSHANHGLLGLRGISGPRDPPREPIVLGEETKVIGIPLPCQGSVSENASSISMWRSRGWVFQESFFGGRKLIFYDGHVGWQCHGGFRLELYDSETASAINDVSIEHFPKESSVLRRQKRFSGPMLDIKGLVVLLSEFNCRHFTYPEDVLDAFSGVASFLHGRSHGALSFISGLPRMFFSFALLWRPSDTERREPKNSPANFCLPSWSWVGWQSAVAVFYWNQIAIYQMEHEHNDWSWQDKIYSSVKWNGYRDINDKTGIDLHDEWANMRDRFIDNIAEPTPNGWTRHLVPPDLSEKLCRYYRDDFLVLNEIPSSDNEMRSSDIDPAVCHPRCYYTHESRPDDEVLFPTPPCRTSEAQKHLHIQLISCVTWRAYLEVGGKVGDDSLHDRLTCSLHNGEGDIVGALDVCAVLSRGKSEFYPPSGSSVELVEVAHGVKKLEPFIFTRRQPFPELRQHNWPTEGEDYAYVWVLGIHWTKGIAYRHSIGRVMKDKWDKLKKDEIKLLLG